MNRDERTTATLYAARCNASKRAEGAKDVEKEARKVSEKRGKMLIGTGGKKARCVCK